jgi:hypothetical protein
MQIAARPDGQMLSKGDEYGTRSRTPQVAQIMELLLPHAYCPAGSKTYCYPPQAGYAIYEGL